jgi:hypothetical protein
VHLPPDAIRLEGDREQTIAEVGLSVQPKAPKA